MLGRQAGRQTGRDLVALDPHGEVGFIGKEIKTPNVEVLRPRGQMEYRVVAWVLKKLTSQDLGFFISRMEMLIATARSCSEDEMIQCTENM